MRIFFSIFNYCTGFFQAAPEEKKTGAAEKAAGRAEDKATELATRVAHLEGRIDPLVELVNTIHRQDVRDRIDRDDRAEARRQERS